MLHQSADADQFMVVVFAVCCHIDIWATRLIGPKLRTWLLPPLRDQTARISPAHPQSHRKAEYRLHDSAASDTDSAARSDSPAVKRSALARCLRSFAAVRTWRRLSRSAWAPIATTLRYKDVSAARTIRPPAILQQSFPCTYRRRVRQLPRPRQGHA